MRIASGKVSSYRIFMQNDVSWENAQFHAKYIQFMGKKITLINYSSNINAHSALAAITFISSK